MLSLAVTGVALWRRGRCERPRRAFLGGMFVLDNFALFFKALILLSSR